MCGRFAIISPVSELIEAFELAQAAVNFSARYNVAPTQSAPVILSGEQGRQLKLFRWGLVPHWAKDEKMGNKLINARSETAAEKPSFRDAMKHRRCLVPCDGFYEWKKVGSAKQPHFIKLKSGRPFALAGLWERWDKGPELLFSFTLLTCAPNPLMARLHNRMPVILPQAAHESWLDCAEDIGSLLLPYPAQEMEFHQVSGRVNSPAHEGPELIKPTQLALLD